MTGPMVASIALDAVQLCGVGAIVYFTHKTQQSVARYRETIDRYAEYLKQREKLLDQREEALNACKQ